MDKKIAIIVTIVALAVVCVTAVALITNNNAPASEDVTITFDASEGKGTFEINGKETSTIKVKKGTTWSTNGLELKFSNGTIVKAKPSSGYQFKEWSQSSGKADSNKTLSASFIVEPSEKYTIKFETDAKGSVSSDQIEVSKGTGWTSNGEVLTFNDGQKIVATAKAGYVFNAWSLPSGTVTEDTTIKATFKDKEAESFKVTIKTDGNGTVDKKEVNVTKGTKWSTSGSKLSFSDGNTINATPNAGYVIDSWSPSSGTVSSDLSINVKFAAKPSNSISFYFKDNFEYDEFTTSSMYATDPSPVIPGVWVKGNGTNVESALKDACKTFGIDVSISNGKITKINTVVDGNISIQAWDGSKWVSKKSLSEVSGDSKYIAIVHGAKSASGADPSVGTAPNEIKWHFGDEIEHKASGKKVIFYVNTQFKYSEFTSKRSDASNPLTLIVEGLWISGYAAKGEQVEVALKNALDEIGYSYQISNGFINAINKSTGGNFFQAGWDGNKWVKGDGTVWLQESVDDNDYICIAYGAWGDGFVNPPMPDKTVADMKWYY